MGGGGHAATLALPPPLPHRAGHRQASPGLLLLLLLPLLLLPPLLALLALLGLLGPLLPLALLGLGRLARRRHRRQLDAQVDPSLGATWR